MNKIVRFLLFFICSVIILLIVITLLLPAEGKIVKEKNINSSKRIVMEELTNVRNYTLWYPWLQIGGAKGIKYIPGGKSFHWVSKIQKDVLCNYQITGIEGDSLLHFKFIYGSTPPITGAYILRSSEDSLSTTVIWYMNMKAGWTPWWRFYGAMMDKMNGPLLETGLTNLKVICEKQMHLQPSGM